MSVRRATGANARAPGEPGKTLRLTKKLGRAIVEHVATGTPKTLAAHAEGVSEHTIWEWVRRGEGRDDRPPTELMRWFAGEMRRAEAADVNRRKQRLELIAERDDALAVKVDTFWLERRHPDEFGRRDRMDHAGEVSHRVVVEMAFSLQPLKANVQRRLEAGGVIDVEPTEEEGS